MAGSSKHQELNPGMNTEATPLHSAASTGDVVRLSELLHEGKHSVSCIDGNGQTPLHCACKEGHLCSIMLLLDYWPELSIQDNHGVTSVMLAASAGLEDVVYRMLSMQHLLHVIKDENGRTVLHYACAAGNLSLVRSLVKHHHADIHAQTNKGDTPLHVAALNGRESVAMALISEFGCKRTWNGSLLDSACIGGNFNLVCALIKEDRDDTRHCLRVAAENGKKDLVLDLIEHYNYTIDKSDISLYCFFLENVLLHSACKGGNVDLVQALIDAYGAHAHSENSKGNTPLHTAALHGQDEVVFVLILKYKCSVSATNKSKKTLLHLACEGGYVDLVRKLIRNYKADLEAQTYNKDTPLLVAAYHGRIGVVCLLIQEFGCNPNSKNSSEQSLLHIACEMNNVDLARILVTKCNADSNITDADGNTPLHTFISCSCANLDLMLNMVRTLVHECNAEVNLTSASGDTLLHAAISRYTFDSDLMVNIVHTLVHECKAEVNLTNAKGDTPLHLAASNGRDAVVKTLLEECNCDANIRGYKGRSVLHAACTSPTFDVVERIGALELPLVVDDEGNTPLHVACTHSHVWSILTLLDCLDPPILLRNNNGKTARDVASFLPCEEIDRYMRMHKERIYTHYDDIQKKARRKFSGAELVTRVFVIGNRQAGKSSLVEALKREAFFESFRRVSEFSVPPHTAGIVPSIHTSRHYGRVLFYDFAGDPEYYSSHAAILENLVSLRKGDNLFIMVVDLSKDSSEIRKTFYYWLSFIRYQKFSKKEPFLLLIGSHSDKLSKNQMKDKVDSLQKLCDHIHTGCGISNKVKYFVLDCRNPKSLSDIQREIKHLTDHSPRYELSLPAIILLGLLEKDFRNEAAFCVRDLQSHIKTTGIQLPTEVKFLRSILLELHEMGLLFIIADGSHSEFHIVLNLSKLTNSVHQLLFSSKAREKMCTEHKGSFNIGIIPQGILVNKFLPPNITKECLIQLQYCQQISHRDIGAFPSLTHDHDSFKHNLPFLFFPALCSVDRSAVSWKIQPDCSFSIGWLAQCTDPQDYFPPRFLHVLLLRLVFRFTLSAPSIPGQEATPNSYFQRRCTMWRMGVHWFMKEGVECEVKLVNDNRDVVIVMRSECSSNEKCIDIFHRIINCVMEAKEEFCHTTKLQTYVLDSTDETDYHKEDNLFAISEVEQALTSIQEEVVVSLNGNGRMKKEKVLPLRRLTYWRTLFPIDFVSVLHLLEGIVRGLYSLGLCLGLSEGTLDGIDVDFPNDVGRRRRELVKVWLSSSQDPPCWWHLVQALKARDERVLAERIEREHSVSVQLQEKLLAPQYRDLKPDEEFIKSLANVVGSMWPSLAACLSLSDEAMGEVSCRMLSTECDEQAFQILGKWCSSEDATYHKLCKKMLKTISLF